MRALLLVFACVLAEVAHADYVEVSRDSVVRAGPGSNSDERLDATPGMRLALLPIPDATNDQRNGYYNVTLPGSSESGWIYRTFVRRFPGSIPGAGQPVVLTPTGGALEVHVIDVGQGDAIYIRCPDGVHQMLIDAGDNRYPGSSTLFKTYFQAHHAATDELEVVIASHQHADHIGSMRWVVANFPIGLYVDNGLPYHTDTFAGVATALDTRGVAHFGVVEAPLPDIDFCPRADVSAQLLVPAGFGTHSDPNDNSVVVRVQIGNTSFLFVGDTEGVAETELVNDPTTGPLLNCDFLKVGHHGSDTSTKNPFVTAVSPTVCAVSCGEAGVGTNKGYMHPRAETLTRLLGVAGPRQGAITACPAFDASTNQWDSIALDRAVYVTSVEGNLVFRSSGNGVERVIP